MNRSKSKKNKKALQSSPSMTQTTNAVTKTQTPTTKLLSQSSNVTSPSTTPTAVLRGGKNHHIFPEPKKIERSNSFVLSKLSDFYHRVRGSQDNLNKIVPEKPKPQPVFLSTTGRSQTLAEISSVRKSYRRSIREPKLEELQEEHDTIIETQIIEEPTSPVILRQKPFEDDESSKGLFSRLRRTFSIKPDRRKSMNSKWSNSLQSLQNIDTMVSYEDLRFIDYDKFNTYEKQINQRISLTLSQKSIDQPASKIEQTSAPPASQSQPKTVQPQHLNSVNQVTSPIIIVPPPSFPTDVRRRPKKKQRSASDRFSSNFDASIETNFDVNRNLYRQSFDRRTLDHFNDINRDSFRMSACHDITDSLLLENYLAGKTSDQVDGGKDDVAAQKNQVSGKYIFF